MDPDNLNIATVMMPGYRDPIEVHLQMTLFADMTIGEVLQLMVEYRREDPEATEIYHDRLMQAKIRRFADISTIGVEHDLPRSYTTIEECKAMAKAVFAGARVIRTETLPGTTAPNAITSLAPGAGVFQIGGGASVIDGVVNVDPVETDTDITNPDDPAAISDDLPVVQRPVEAALQKPRKAPVRKGRSMKFVCPDNLKELE